MRFANLQAGHLFWVVAGLILFFIWSDKNKKKALSAFADKKVLVSLVASFNPKNYRLKKIIIVAACSLIVFALMRPQWGFNWQEVKRKGLDIVVAVDVSKSMLAEDIKPNRLERTKLALADFTKHLNGDRIGLIAFAGSAFLQCPLTVDYNGFLLSVENLDVNLIPRGGTCLSCAINEAVKSYEGGVKKYKVLIIITDGESHTGNPERAAQLAKAEGIKIFSIGIGTSQGELIPITYESGSKGFLKDRDGNVVKTSLDETGLEKIALTTGGSYVRAGSAEFGLELIYNQKLSKMERRELEAKMAKRYEERFQIPLFLALVLLIAELFIGDRRKSFKKAGLLALLITVLLPQTCFAAQAAVKVNSGNRHYRRGDFDQALKDYNQAMVDAPDSDIINFNQAAAFYKKEDYEKAREYFTKSLISDNRKLEADALYNIGNCKYKSGQLKKNTDLEEAVNLYRQALDYYKRAVEIDQSNQDARFNHEFVERELKALLDKLKRQQDKQNQAGQQKEREQGERQSGSSSSGAEGEENKGQEQKEAGTALPEDKDESGAGLKKSSGLKQQEDEDSELSQDQARMLLERYNQDDGGQLNLNKSRQPDYPPVLKDW